MSVLSTQLHCIICHYQQWQCCVSWCTLYSCDALCTKRVFCSCSVSLSQPVADCWHCWLGKLAF